MKSPDHYHFDDLIRHLVQIGKNNEVDRLRALDRAVEAALDLRNAEANKTLQENLPQIVSLLRPCHRRRVDHGTLNVYGWKYC
jgi:hypothetical protein